jgi:uncharacterized membrane protein affecting hemolysin expression
MTINNLDNHHHFYEKNDDDDCLLLLQLLLMMMIIFLNITLPLALQHRGTETPSTPRKLVRTLVVNSEILVENSSIITSSIFQDTKSDGVVFVSTLSEL